MDKFESQTIIQLLVKLIDATNNKNTELTQKLDDVITVVSNIKISADSIAVNTDELKTKLDNVVTAINTVNTSINTMNTSINNVNSAIEDNINGVYSIKTDTENILVYLTNGLTKAFNIMNPSHLAIVNTGDTTFDNPVVLCNITEENITVTVTAVDDTIAQSIVLTPGWNPVVIKSITGATANTLIYGY